MSKQESRSTEGELNAMFTNYSYTDILILLIAALGSIHFFFYNPIAQRPRFLNNHRSSLSSSTRTLKMSSSMAITHLLHASNTDTVSANSKEPLPAASCPNTMTEDSGAAPISEKSEPNASPLSYEGVELPGSRLLEGQTLIRNGHGLRSITYFGLGIRCYVGAMYSARPILSLEQVLGSYPSTTTGEDLATVPDNGPLQFDFTFLRGVSQSRVVSAWTQQLDYSVSYKDYEGYEADRKRLIELASGRPIEKFGTQTFQLVGDETRIIDQGSVTGTIHGRDFQRSFLSMWFGANPVSENLKVGLLKGDEHQPVEIES